ncbi:MAG: hypothetical protein AB7S75_18785 [Desulfococcaceae bacterium]
MLDIFLYAAGVLILAEIIIFGVVAPIIVHSKQRQSAKPRFDLFDPRNLPQDKADYFVRNLQLLQKEGFEPAAFVSWESNENQRILFVLTVNRKNRDMAMSVLATGGTATKPIEIRYTEFCTVFGDSSEINTNSNPQPDVLKQFPDKKVFSFPSIKDPHHLYILHRRLIARFALGKEAVLPSKDTEVMAVQMSVTRFLARQAKAGYFQTDESGEILMPTWKGAFLMTWKLVWPVSFIRNILQRRRMNIFLRQLLSPEVKHGPRQISEQIVNREDSWEKKFPADAASDAEPLQENSAQEISEKENRGRKENV